MLFATTRESTVQLVSGYYYKRYCSTISQRLPRVRGSHLTSAVFSVVGSHVLFRVNSYSGAFIYYAIF